MRVTATPAVCEAVGEAWRYRERVEREAAILFDDLATGLAEVGWPGLAERAAVAAADERRHAARCRDIVDACLLDRAPLPLARHRLGPSSLGRRDQVLFASVAVGCVTETLSCALLLEMRQGIELEPVRVAVEEIVRDEIEHSRLGWAHLAAEAARGDVAWLAPHVEAMRRAALTHDVEPPRLGDDLGAYGILSAARVAVTVDAAWRDIVVPGLALHGVVI